MSSSGDQGGGLEAAFARALAELVEPGTGVLLAVSGGSDSMGLMHLTAGAARSLGLELAVGFVDHGLRPDVGSEWDLVSRQADRLGLGALRAAVDSEEAIRGRDDGSIQQWARQVRYRELAAMAREAGLGHVATGHTVDDQAETVVLRLVRGTGIDGLGGMRPARELGPGVVLIRPLLKLARADIRDWLERAQIPWIEDPSNVDPRFRRSRVRADVLPQLESLQPGVAGRIAALAGEAAGVSRFLDEMLGGEKYCKNLRLANGLKVDYQVFSSLPPSIRSRLLRTALHRVRGDLRRIERAHLEPIEELIRSGGTGGPLPVPGDAEIHVDRGTLLVFPGPIPPPPTGSGQPVVAGSGLWNARFAALGAIAEIRAAGPEQVEDLEVRARRPGDRLHGSETKLKELLIEQRVPRPYRDFVPVLAGGDRIVAAPGLLRCRREGVEVGWLLDEESPFLDIDFPRSGIP